MDLRISLWGMTRWAFLLNATPHHADDPVGSPLVVDGPSGSVGVVLKDELRQLLRELAGATGAVSVAIAHPEPPPDEDGNADDEANMQAPHSMSVPVGGGVPLRMNTATEATVCLTEKR